MNNYKFTHEISHFNPKNREIITKAQYWFHHFAYGKCLPSHVYSFVTGLDAALVDWEVIEFIEEMLMDAIEGI